jgi:uncharacterized protein
MKRPALLDVNVLIALFDPGHVHHELAHDWFAEESTNGWATCPLTELAFVRILSNPALGPDPERPLTLLRHLRQFCKSADHVFWTDTLSLRDEKVFDLAFASHRQLTDVYLLGLAHKKGGRLATFDRTIPVKAVGGAHSGVLQIISLVESQSLSPTSH